MNLPGHQADTDRGAFGLVRGRNHDFPSTGYNLQCGRALTPYPLLYPHTTLFVPIQGQIPLYNFIILLNLNCLGLWAT